MSESADKLGVSFMTGTAAESGYDLNKFKVRGGFMRFNANTVNAPITGWGIVIALSEDEGRYFHIAFCYNGAYAFSVHTRFFHGNTWEAWKQFSLT